MRLIIAIERKGRRRWTAELRQFPGAIVQGRSRDEAIRNAERLAIVFVEDRVVHGEMSSAETSLPRRLTVREAD